ncbi:MAG: hypothetical protein QOG82_600 [Actinomycetota bacterium]|nr:hypothetical protein [Actinomycetota bacterium]
MAAGSSTNDVILGVLAGPGGHGQTGGTTSDGRDPADWAELVGGLTARRARTLLFLIESRTGHLAARARQAMAPFLTDDTVRDRDLAFLDAFARGREPPYPVRIHDLERYAAHWAPLVPANPRGRAALAHLLGQKYVFTRDAVPGIGAAVGFDDERVAAAYEQLYGEPLDNVFADEVGPGGRLRWLWTRFATRLESLPPAWSAYVLSLTETVGTSMLALPIAVAGIGPLAGVVVIVVLGLVNIVTAAAMGEAVGRSGSVRYGAAYIGKMVQDYLGGPGSVVLTAALFVLTFLIMVADQVGIGSTMAGATGLPPEAFVGILFAVVIFMIRRGSLDATIAAAIVVGAVNLTMIAAIAVLSIPSLELANVTRIELPFVAGRPFEPALIGSVFGVILAAFFGHLAVSLCGQEVLRREPTGKALVRGVVGAQVTALVAYCLWVLAVGGVVDGGVLAAEHGTALVPLADEVGPMVSILGSVYVVLGMGMGSIHYGLALYNLTRERLPSRPDPVVLLPRRGGNLVLSERRPSSRRPPARIAITYLGLDRGPRFRLDVDLDGELHRVEATAEDPWALLGDNVQSPLTKAVPGIGERGLEVTLDILDSSPGSVRLRVATGLAVAYEGDWDALGTGLADLLAVDEAEAAMVGWLAREGSVGFEQVVAQAGGDRTAAREVLELLLERGLVAESDAAGEHRYHARMAVRRPRNLPDPVWDAMATDADPAGNGEPGGPDTSGQAATADGAADSTPRDPSGLAPTPALPDVRRVLAGNVAGVIAGVAPVTGAFALAAWMLATGSGSFAGLIGFVGVIVVSLLAGVYPVLLLASSRRRGEYTTAATGRIRGHPVVLVAIYVLSVASVFLHGVVIWDDPWRRAGGLLAGIGILVLTVAVWKGGAFRRRLVVEVRAVDDEPADRAYFSMTAGGQPAPGEVVLTYVDGSRVVHDVPSGQIADYPSFRTATFRPVGPPVHDVKVWLHHVTFTGDSFPLQARASIDGSDGPVALDVGITTSQVVVTVAPAAESDPVVVRVEMEDQDAPASTPSVSRP